MKVAGIVWILLFGLNVQAEPVVVYSWLDEEGVRHFADKPLHQNAELTELATEMNSISWRTSPKIKKLPPVAHRKAEMQLTQKRLRCEKLELKINTLQQQRPSRAQEAKHREKLRNLKWQKLIEC